jgi:hypothetical protein
MVIPRETMKNDPMRPAAAMALPTKTPIATPDLGAG